MQNKLTYSVKDRLLLLFVNILVVVSVMALFVVYSNSSIISQFMPLGFNLDKTEYISAFKLKNIDNELYIVDNLDKYTQILDNNNFSISLSPNKNKIHIEYKGNDNNGVVVISHNNKESSYRVDNDTYISLDRGDGKYTIKQYVLKSGNRGILKGEIVVDAINTHSITNNLGQSYEINDKLDSNFTDLVSTVWNQSNGNRDYIANSYQYVSKIEYDYTKADDITNHKYYIYKSDINNTINSKSGICLDKAGLLVAMLRAKGIPSRIVRGYYLDEYHAWVEVYGGKEWFLLDPTLSVKYTDDKVQNYRVSAYT